MKLGRAVRHAVLLAATSAAGGLLAVHPLAGQSLERTRSVTVERTQRGWLGLSLREVLATPGTPGAIQGVRLVVTDLYPGGPAEAGGLRAGDVLVRMNGSPAEILRFRSLADRLLPGDPLLLSVIRDGRPLELSIEAGAAPERDEFVRQILQVHLDSVRVAFAPRLDSLESELRLLEVRGSLLASAPHVQVATVDGDTLKTYVVVTGPDGDRVTLTELQASAEAGAHGGVTSRGTTTATGRTGTLRPVDARSVVRLQSAMEDSARRDVERSAWTEWQFKTPYVTGANRVAGAALRALGTGLGSYFGVEQGVLVLEVAEGTPARTAGLAAGDVIVRAQGQSVDGVPTLRRLLARSLGAVELTVVRRGRTIALTLPG